MAIAKLITCLPLSNAFAVALATILPLNVSFITFDFFGDECFSDGWLAPRPFFLDSTFLLWRRPKNWAERKKYDPAPGAPSQIAGWRFFSSPVRKARSHDSTFKTSRKCKKEAA